MNANDPIENAIVERLVENWPRRASVKRRGVAVDDSFDFDRPDYPERLLPFCDHVLYRQLPADMKSRILGWAWVAFNKNIVDIEQYVVNPGFALLAAGTFDSGLGEAATTAVVQAMVDEQYHTLLHLDASATMRRRRGWSMPETALPLAYKARRHRQRMQGAVHPWQHELTSLAYTTAAEISVNAYLDLVADDEYIQPLHRATASLHSRDEYCHAQIAAEIVKAVYPRFDEERRRFFLDALADGMEAFAANDFATWYRIVDLAAVPDGAPMIQAVEQDPRRKRIFQDFSGLRSLCREMNVLEDLHFDWSSVTFGGTSDTKALSP